MNYGNLIERNEHSVMNDDNKWGIEDQRHEERRAQDTRTHEPRGETHAYANRRNVANDETPLRTNSTVIVDLVSPYVNYPDSTSAISRKTPPDVPSCRYIDNIANRDVIEIARIEQTKVTIDHVYEEVVSYDETEATYEILNYEEYRSREKSNESVVDTFVLPSHKICSQCANSSRGSPVIYSDRLIRGKCKISAKETIFRHAGLYSSQLYFGYRSSASLSRVEHFFRQFIFDKYEDYMPVSNLPKTNNSGILYGRSILKDAFDLEISLGPCISLLGDISAGKSDETNTQVYHRFAKNYYSRISEIGAQSPMIFPKIKSSRIFSTVKSTVYDENTIYWMNCDDDLKKNHDTREEPDEQQIISLSTSETHNNNRSSLLLLEPLLLMPEIAGPRQNIAKNRITRTEHVKIVRMVIAYTLSFFLLAIITFYIVYFT